MAALPSTPQLTELRKKCDAREKLQVLLSDPDTAPTPTLMGHMRQALIDIRQYWVENVVEIYDPLSAKEYMELAHACHVPSQILTKAFKKYVESKGTGASKSKEGESCQDTLCIDTCECNHLTRKCVKHHDADKVMDEKFLEFQRAAVKPSVISTTDKLEWWGLFISLLKKHYDAEFSPEIPKFLHRLRLLLIDYKEAESKGTLTDPKVIEQLQEKMKTAYEGPNGICGSGNVAGQVFTDLKKASKREWLTRTKSIIDPTADKGIWMRVLASVSDHVISLHWTDDDLHSPLATAFYEKYHAVDPEPIVSEAHSSDNYRELFDDSVYKHYENGLDYDYAYRHTNYDGVYSKHASAHSLPFDERNQYQPLFRGEYNHESGSESSLLIGGVVGASAVVIIMLIFCLGLAFGMIIYWGYSQKRALDVKRNKGEMRNWIDDNEDRNEV
eukprot:305486_1